MKLIAACLFLVGGILFSAAGLETPQTVSAPIRPQDELPMKPVIVPKRHWQSAVGSILPDLSGVDFTKAKRDMYGDCGEYHDLALSVGWPEEEWKTLSMIMQRESKCQPDAWSGSDAGLMQINRIHTEWAAQMGFVWPDDLFNARNNLLFSYRLWEASGWRPWSFSGSVPE